MTEVPPVPTDDEESSVADRVARAVRAVPGVVDLHAGAFAQVGTLLPGRRVDGVRLGAEVAEVHLSIEMGRPVAPLADDVVAAVRAITGTRVEVVVEDVVPVGTDLPTPTTTHEENH